MINLETEILWSLRVGDLEIEYDRREGEGAYEALTPTAQEELINVVQRLIPSLGDAWADYMSAAVDEALRYRQID
jgi:predicted nucleic acid-binding OB-fold protein